MEETVILEFKVDQAAAQKSLEQTEKNLIDLKDAQRDLTKEYNKGNITQTQYVRENLKLQNAIKKEQDQKRTLIKTVETESNSRNALRLQISKLAKEYDNLNQETEEGVKRAKDLENELTRLSNQLTKGDKAANLFKNQIGNYPEQFGEAAKSINVAGVSVNDLTGNLSSFLNPATAVVGVVTAIGAAYANSAVGARDLAKAQNLVAAAISVVSNDLGRLVSPNSDNGLLTQVVGAYGDYFKTIVNISTYGLLNDYLDGVEDRTKRIADAQERLNDLTISSAFAKGFAKDDERRAEILRRIRDDEEKSLEERLSASEKIDQILTSSGNRSAIVLQAQISAIKESTEGYESNRQAQLEVANLTAEIADKEEEITGKLTENVTARKSILAAQKAQQELNAQLARATVRAQTSDDAAILTGSTDINSIPLVQPKSSQDAAVEAQREFANTLLKVNEDYYLADLRNKKAAAELKQQIDEQQLQNTANFLAQGAALFDENTDAFKLFATASTLISTYSAAQKAYEAAFLPVPTIASPALGAAFAAVAVATGLANVAKINGVEFAEGGYTGHGAKYDVAGVVHKGEYVTPKSVVESPAAQPHLAALERMRSGYADGGFVTNRSIDSSQQALIMANAFKNLPAPVVGVREITSVQNRIGVREKAARI